MIFEGSMPLLTLSLPRRRFENIRTRSSQGQLLSVNQEFQAIYNYFSGAFAREDDSRLPALAEPFAFSEAEIRCAIQGLRRGKAVPTTSLPAEVWLLDLEAMTKYCTQVLNAARAWATLSHPKPRTAPSPFFRSREKLVVCAVTLGPLGCKIPVVRSSPMP